MTSWRGYRLLDIMTKCGQRDDLKLCLDAGDSASYSGAGQSWLDQSGNGFDFFRGATSGAAADDPTFNGTAGNLSNAEYWSFDGGDFFRYDAANETWMQNLHKDNAIFSIVAWVLFGATGSQEAVIATAANTLSGTGMTFRKLTGDNMSLNIRNAGTEVRRNDTVTTMSASVWNFVAASLDEPVGANGCVIQINNTQELFTSTYVSPSAGSATATMEIGAGGSGSNGIFGNGSRIAMLAAWEGRALSAGELMAIYMATRGRFAV